MSPKFKEGDRVKYVGAYGIITFTEIVGVEGVIVGEGHPSKQIDDYIYPVKFEYLTFCSLLTLFLNSKRDIDTPYPIYPEKFMLDGPYLLYEHELKPLKKKLMVYYKEEVA